MSIVEEVELDQNVINVYISKPESFQNHSHKKGQLTYFEGGSSHLYTEDTNYFVPTHHFAWIPPDVLHRFEHYVTQGVRVRSFYIPQDYLQYSFFNQIGVFKANSFMLEVFKFMSCGEYKTEDKEFQFFVSFLKLVPDLLQDRLNIKLPLSNHILLKEVIEYILNNLSEKLLLNSIASKFNFGAKTFSRLFYREIGMNFHQYVMNARIMKSIELLLEDRTSINSIAYEVGYSSIASYSNAFYLLTGRRPSDYRTK